jgi:excisionase family DNA binding protein
MARLDYDKPGAAEYLQTTERHIDRLVAERKITFYKVGRKVRFRQGDLDDYIERHRLQALR